MRILHTADLHLGYNYSSEFEKETRELLKNNHKKVLQNIIAVGEDNNCDVLIICGDLFDSEPSTQLVSFVIEVFKRTKMKIFITPGNHDHLGLNCYKTEFPQNVYIFKENLEKIELDDKTNLYGIGFLRAHETETLVPNLNGEENKTNILMVHGEVLADSFYNPILRKDMTNINYLLLGHIHIPYFSDEYSYCGAPQPMRFKEDFKPSVNIIDLETKENFQISVHEHRFMTVEVEVNKDIEKQILDKLKDEKNILLKVILNGALKEGETLPLLEIQNKYKNLILNIRFIENYEIDYPIDLIKKEQSIRGEFVRCAFENIDDEVFRNKVIATGISYLKRG